MSLHLHDYLNSRCEVRTEEDSVLAIGKISAYTKGGSVEIAPVGGGKMPEAEFNPNVLLYISGAGGAGDYVKMKGKVYTKKPKFWGINNLQQLNGSRKQDTGSNRRLYFRVPNRVRATVMGGGGGDTYACHVQDISVSGIGFIVEDKAFSAAIDSTVMLNDVRIGENSEPFQFTCRVRRKEIAETGLFYGCSIESLSHSEEDRLCQAVFSQQRAHIKKHRGY